MNQRLTKTAVFEFPTAATHIKPKLAFFFVGLREIYGGEFIFPDWLFFFVNIHILLRFILLDGMGGWKTVTQLRQLMQEVKLRSCAVGINIFYEYVANYGKKV